MSSFLSVAKKLSATALSKQSPRAAHRLGDAGGAGLLAEGQRRRTGCPGRSARSVRAPGGGCASAICSASVTSSVRM